jgi:diacylglycerol kinase (ATP)
VSETVVLVNPRAGSGRGAVVWERARAEVEGAEQLRVVLAGEPEAAARQLGEALGDPEVRRLIAVGGDGTLHLAANRLVAHGLTERVALGMVPAGTGSDLAKALGLPRAPAAALRHALGAEPRAIDLLRVECGGHRRVVLNVASAGISGPVAERVNATPVKRPTVYLTGALAAVATYRPFHGRVTVDGESFYDGGVYLLAVANGPAFGKGMKVAPGARMDDGLAEVVVVEAMPRWRVPLRLPRLYLGTILGSRAVQHRRGRHVELHSPDPLPPLEIDGETLPATSPLTIDLLPSSLRFLA